MDQYILQLRGCVHKVTDDETNIFAMTIAIFIPAGLLEAKPMMQASALALKCSAKATRRKMRALAVTA